MLPPVGIGTFVESELDRFAERVYLVHCETPDTTDPRATREHLGAVRDWLSVHKVDAVPLIETSRAKADHVLLSRATELGADLIACGAYGRARWREQVLGGVTQTLLHKAELPLLMSH